MNTLQALQFAIDFAQLDLAAVNHRDFERRVQEFVQLPERAPLYADGSGQGWFTVAAISPDALRRLQTDTRALLDGILERGHHHVGVTLQLSLTRPRRYVRPPRSRADLDRVERVFAPEVWLAVGGTMHDRFIYRLMRLVETLGVEKLRRCPDPACRRLFYQVTRKEFCSTRCQSRVYMRGYRTQKKGGRRGKAARTR